MENNNLCCLIDRANRHVTLDLLKISETTQIPEIDLEKEIWRSNSCSWRKIGYDLGEGGEIWFIFDMTNLEHLKRAIEIAQNFQR